MLAASPMAIALGLCSIGCSAEAVDHADSVGTDSESIVNGITLSETDVLLNGMVAIYHKKANGNFFPRPCSGVLIETSGTWNTIVTARHCVTRDGTVDGPMFSPSEVGTSIMVKATATPGLTADSPTPPAGAIGAQIVEYAAIESGVSTSSRDLATVSVVANWANRAPNLYQTGVYMGDPAALIGKQVTAFGYGVNELHPTNSFPEDTCYSTNPNPTHNGAGTARRSNPFTVNGGLNEGFYGGVYNHNNDAGGTKVLCGDSGGPDFGSLPTNGVPPVQNQTGVHSGASYTSTTNSRVGPWLAAMRGGFFVSPHSDKTRALGFIGSSLVLYPRVNASPGAFVFLPPLQRIAVYISDEDALCLDSNAGGLLATCSSQLPTNQRWIITGNNQIQNVATGQCLQHRTDLNGVTLEPCLSASAAQTWFWHPEIDTTYAFCANENATCSFSGTRNVRYGANGIYAYRMLSNGAPCNNTTFGDPVPGVGKQCAIGPRDFTFCSNENASCTNSGSKIIAYGGNGSFIYRVKTGNFTCSNASFGEDPIPGVVKACYRQN